jgi:hypothetical protein
VESMGAYGIAADYPGYHEGKNSCPYNISYSTAALNAGAPKN